MSPVWKAYTFSGHQGASFLNSKEGPELGVTRQLGVARSLWRARPERTSRKCRAAPSAPASGSTPPDTCGCGVFQVFSKGAPRAGLGTEYSVEVLGPAQSCIVSHGLRPQSDRLVWSGSAHGQIRLFDGGPRFPPSFPRVSVRLLDPGVVGRRGTVVLPEEEMTVRRTGGCWLFRMVRCQEPTSSATI